jgi:hypothetical protein
MTPSARNGKSHPKVAHSKQLGFAWCRRRGPLVALMKSISNNSAQVISKLPGRPKFDPLFVMNNFFDTNIDVRYGLMLIRGEP